MSDLRFLLVPGGGGSDAGHWHHDWAATDGRFSWVNQLDWDGGTRDQWVACLDTEIQRSPEPAVLIAHSLGNMVLAHWAARHSGPVVGALLVAPADVAGDWVPPSSLYERFRPIPLNPLPFPTVLVASTDDPYLSIDRATELANAWASELKIVGPHGHLGADADLGAWTEGQHLLEALLERIPGHHS